MTQSSFRDSITFEPGKRGGQPCIRGMRITVHEVLSYLSSGMTPAQILEDFPYLVQEDIQACLAYAHNHRAAGGHDDPAEDRRTFTVSILQPKFSRFPGTSFAKKS